MLVTVYIRKADEELWKALPNKTAAISDLLNGTARPSPVLKEETRQKLLAQPKKKEPEIPNNLKPRMCPNGHAIPYPRENCLGKGCKYS